MTEPEPLTLDVREQLRGGGEPLPRILKAVGALQPGQSLRLRATFEPLPLYAVLSRKGLSHQSRQIAAGDWEVLFSPAGSAGVAAAGATANAAAAPTSADRRTVDTRGWPAAQTRLDNRGLMPPEPLVRILAALEQLPAGAVLEAINEREPVFLYPQLEQRHAQIHTEPQHDGGVRLLIRRGAA